MFSWQEKYLTRSLRSLVRYCSCHSNIKFISSCHCVISSIYRTEQDSAKMSSFGWNLDFLWIIKVDKKRLHLKYYRVEKLSNWVWVEYESWRYSRISIASAVIKKLLSESAWCLCCFRVQQHTKSEGRNWTPSDTFMERKIRRKEKEEKSELTSFNWRGHIGSQPNIRLSVRSNSFSWLSWLGKRFMVRRG